MNKKYKYHNGDYLFTLEKIDGCIYKFTCGHWVTDNVFNTMMTEIDSNGQLKLIL